MSPGSYRGHKWKGPTEPARWGLICTGVASHHEADRQLAVIANAHGTQVIAP